MDLNLDFYRGKRVFLTGHTGFKGTWMSRILLQSGAELTGYSLCREKSPDFFRMSDIFPHMNSIRGDVRDLDFLQKSMTDAKPQIVIHMAAQPIVRTSYLFPVETYSTNVMGTVNVLESVRNCPSVESVLNVTTDKVYYNDERAEGFREEDPLDGFDPYSNSKSCSDMVTHSYNSSFLSERNIAVSTARAGNVIGGGDFSTDRIIPDCVRSTVKGEPIRVRNPYSTRPYQHVLEPVMAYLMIGQGAHPGWYNVGPDDSGCSSTGELVNMFVKHWGDGASWFSQADGGPHEAGFLKLDNSKLKSTFDWSPVWNLDTAVEKAVEWYKLWNDGGDINGCMDRQIREYLSYKS